MSEHTNGPWEVGSHQRIITTGWPITTNDGTAVAYVLGERNPELQQNARLIAAAPDLLYALQYTIQQLPGLASVSCVAAALAKVSEGAK